MIRHMTHDRASLETVREAVTFLESRNWAPRPEEKSIAT
jgi:hypothetical protein